MTTSVNWNFEESSTQPNVFCLKDSNNAPVSVMEAFSHFLSPPMIPSEPGERSLSLQLQFSQFILQYPAPAIFFEMPPVTFSSVHTRPFEFVLLPAPRLSLVLPDTQPFQEKFDLACSSDVDARKRVVHFKNIGGDCTLIAPCPVYTDNHLKNFAHLVEYLKNADDSSIQELWKVVATQLFKRLDELKSQNEDDVPVWVSTSGLGVSWLHVRLDSVPKYYNFVHYKVF